MIKFKLQVFDCETNTLICTVNTSPNLLLDTIRDLSELGIVKGYVVEDSKESEE